MVGGALAGSVAWHDLESRGAQSAENGIEINA
jgi:hypothetical protein